MLTHKHLVHHEAASEQIDGLVLSTLAEDLLWRLVSKGTTVLLETFLGLVFEGQPKVDYF